MSKLKIEAGKCYRTRSGDKAFVAAAAPENCYPAFVGWMLTGDLVGKAYGWNEDAKNQYRGGSDRGDLVAEWVDPPKPRTWTVYIYRYEPAYQIVSLTAPPPNAKILAKVQVTEGEGV